MTDAWLHAVGLGYVVEARDRYIAAERRARNVAEVFGLDPDEFVAAAKSMAQTTVHDFPRCVDILIDRAAATAARL